MRAPSGTKKKSQGVLDSTCCREVTLMETTAGETRSAAATKAVRREPFRAACACTIRVGVWAPTEAILSGGEDASRQASAPSAKVRRARLAQVGSCTRISYRVHKERGRIAGCQEVQ